MIRVTFQTRQAQLIGFEMSGHAGFDEYGKDIVCAAVSALAINTVNAIEALLHEPFDCKVEEDGFLHFIMKSKPTEMSTLLLNTLELGVTGIENQYGKQYINVKHKEV